MLCDAEHCFDCANDKYGKMCEKLCPSHCAFNETRMCDRESGYCSRCEKNYYGLTCENECQNCDDRVEGNNCNISGICEKCKDGYYSKYCNVTCEPNCKRLNKVDLDSCHRESGICVECMNTFYGKKCEFNCSSECKIMDDINNTTCHKETGKCTECAKNDHYGDYCNLNCSQKCSLEFNDTLRICDRKGICKNCTKGFWSHLCDEPCPDGCDYIGEESCSRDSGICKKCLVGYYGELCSKCDTPLHHCVPFTPCNESVCEICDAGYWNALCTEKCPEHCSICFKSDGKCQKCSNKKYGSQCQNSCSNCKNGCNMEGFCIESSCDKNYYGIGKCSSKCEFSCIII